MRDSLAIRPKPVQKLTPDSLAIRPKLVQKLTLRYEVGSIGEVTKLINSDPFARAAIEEFSFSAQDPDNVPIPYPFLSPTKHDWVLSALRHVCRLHNLKVLHCYLPLVSHKDLLHFKKVEEFDKYRGEIVKNMLTCLGDGPAERDATLTKLESLEITNLPCRRQPDLTGNPRFPGFLQKLKALKLRFDYASSLKEPYCYAPLDGISHTFFTDLPKTWLEPASTSLTSLTLGANQLWGYLLKVDFHGVHFSNLKSLVMQRFVFSHDWQLTWLLSHKSLDTLSLRQCRMLTEAQWNGDTDKDGYIIEYSSEDIQSPQAYQYDKSWHDYYKKLKGGLENLTSFTTVFDEPSTKMDPGDGQYVEFGWSGWYRVTPHLDTQDKDQEEFNYLQIKISKRRSGQ